LDRVAAERRPGADALDRLPEDLLRHDEGLSALPGDVLNLSLSIGMPECATKHKKVGTTPALSISTEAWSTWPASDFTEFANPREWPNCPVQSAFFRSMNTSPRYPGEDPLAAPDEGWRATLRETVDFSFGSGSQSMTTDLDVVYFNSAARVGCTYDLRESIDGKISVDQGYVLVEDVPVHGRSLRRIRTLKEVHFAAGDLEPSKVCPVWGPAAMLIQWACARRGLQAAARVLSGVAECWGHASSITQRTLAGAYDTRQAFDDAVQYVTRSATLSLDVFTGWIDLLRSAVPPPPTTGTTSAAPLAHLGDVHPSAFRAIGTGNQHSIRASDVTVGTDPTDPGRYTVALSYANVSPYERDRTIIYEGTLHDAAGALVGDPFRIAKPGE
jgi:hypothetical protein